MDSLCIGIHLFAALKSSSVLVTLACLFCCSQRPATCYECIRILHVARMDIFHHSSHAGVFSQCWSAVNCLSVTLTQSRRIRAGHCHSNFASLVCRLSYVRRACWKHEGEVIPLGVPTPSLWCPWTGASRAPSFFATLRRTRCHRIKYSEVQTLGSCDFALSMSASFRVCCRVKNPETRLSYVRRARHSSRLFVALAVHSRPARPSMNWQRCLGLL